MSVLRRSLGHHSTALCGHKAIMLSWEAVVENPAAVLQTSACIFTIL